MDSRETRSHALGADAPRRIGAYELEGKLGEGGMGAVYLARRAGGGPRVAVKVVRGELADDPAFLARFRDEVTNAQRVASFCTAQVFDHGQEDGRTYMVTEYIEGPSLLEYVSEHGELSPGLLNGVAVGVAAALVAIHAAGLVHRDLKPSNVLLSISGPRVIDFGIARALDVAGGHTQTGQVIGSPGWIAPELILNRPITPAVDVFAWGCLVAFAGSGRNPFGVGTFQVMAARVVHAEPEIGPLSEPLAGLVRRALDKDPGNRPTAQELLLWLAGGGGDAAVSTTLHESWSGQDLADSDADPGSGAPAEAPATQPVADLSPARPEAAETRPAAAAQPIEPETAPPVSFENAQPAAEPRPAVAHTPDAWHGQMASHAPIPPPGPAPQPRPVHAFHSPPAAPAQDSEAAPTRWAGGRPARPAGRRGRKGPVLSVTAGVMAVTVGVIAAVLMLRDGDRGGQGAGAASEIPTQGILVRMDYREGWDQGECYARVGRLKPVDGGIAKPQTLLTQNGCNVLPQWSPDRKQMAFTRWAPGAATSDVYVMNADGTGEERRIAQGILPRSRVAWSADGRYIAAMAKVNGVNQIMVGSVDTGRTVQVTDDPYEKNDPTWSREGRIAYWKKTGGEAQLYSIKLDPDDLKLGAAAPADRVPQDLDERRHTTTVIAPNGVNDPIWAPDGRRLAFTLSNGQGKANDIAVIDIGSGAFQQLTKDADIEDMSNHDMDPSFSPDGKWLAFVRGPVSTPEIWAMPLDRSRQARPIGPKGVGHPCWF